MLLPNADRGTVPSPTNDQVKKSGTCIFTPSLKYLWPSASSAPILSLGFSASSRPRRSNPAPSRYDCRPPEEAERGELTENRRPSSDPSLPFHLNVPAFGRDENSGQFSSFGVPSKWNIFCICCASAGLCGEGGGGSKAYRVRMWMQCGRRSGVPYGPADDARHSRLTRQSPSLWHL